MKMGRQRVFHAEPLKVTKETVPMARKRATRVLQAKMDREMYRELLEGLAEDKRTLRELVEWAACQYMLNHAPMRAKRLGIRAGKPTVLVPQQAS